MYRSYGFAFSNYGSRFALENSVVIGISHSGSNKGLLEALEIARARGAKIIAITSYQKSALSQLADITLYTSTRETEFRTEASSSRLAQLSIRYFVCRIVAATTRGNTKNLQSIRETISMKRI